MNSKQLRVDINGEQVGIATQDIDGDITFRYEEGAPRALSLSLPLSPEAKRFKRKACRGYFDGLLPEGDHVREAIARRYGISANNNFSILRAIGEDCAGAVSFHAVGDQAAAEHSDSSELSGSALSDEALEKLLIELPRKPLATGLDGNVRLSLAGAQDKTALLFVDGQAYIPSDGVPSTHILKPSIANFEETVANEYICLSAAAQMGVKVPQVEMRQVGDTPYFLIERYDRQRAGKRVKRVHQEDFCQALNVQCVKKYEKDGGPSFKDCFELLQHCNSPIVARQEMLKRLVFNYLIGNNDAHGKNFSFLYERAGSVVLSPAYDILCTQVYPGISTEMAMLIGKQYRHQEVSLKDWQLLAKDCGLDFSILRSLAMTQAERLPDLLRDLATSFDNKIGAGILDIVRQNGRLLSKTLDFEIY